MINEYMLLKPNAKHISFGVFIPSPMTEMVSI